MSRAALLLLLVPALLLAAPTLASNHLYTYQGAGIVVASFTAPTAPGTPPQQVTVLDNGAVACDTASDSGVGGVCIPFGDLAGDSVLVTDGGAAGLNVAFQVCVDLDGDALCGGPFTNPCHDFIVFSHDTFSGAFHNPLYVNPAIQGLFASCGSAGFPGYIVMVCEGVHGHVPGAPHTHHVTQGTVQGVVTGGTPSGDFCGAPTATKAYAWS